VLKARILTAVPLALALLWALFWPPVAVTVAIFAAIVALGAWEWARFGGLTAPASRLTYVFVVLALPGLYFAGLVSSEWQRTILIVALLWWVAAFAWVCCAPAWQSAWLTLAVGLLVLVSTFVSLAQLQGSTRGPQYVLWMLLMVFGADIGAYAAGRAFGRVKLAPRVSPGKTWEGVFGGIAAATIIGGAGALWFEWPLSVSCLFAMAIGIVSVIGDLTESMFKRAAGLKDSGNLLPGHGGILDRIDSITAAAPLFVLGLELLQAPR
jgi:phosphatidate cytidylyltransferase